MAVIINREKIMEEFKLCYIENDNAYFTTNDLMKQWGDDWNDALYEHNAGIHNEVPRTEKDCKIVKDTIKEMSPESWTEEFIGHECIRQWGTNSQIGIAIEECAELIVELMKQGRKVNGSTHEDVCGEIADVEIMCKQLRMLFNPKTIDNIKKRKLARLQERLTPGLQGKPLYFKSDKEK